MSRHGRSEGMHVGVQVALGVRDHRSREVVICGCGTTKLFDTDPIGQLVEICPRCRTRRVFRVVRPRGWTDAADHQ